MDDCYVYQWFDTSNGKRYIGKGRGDRAVVHLRPCIDSVLSRALRKRREAFRLTYLAVGLTESRALSLEVYLINALDTQVPRGYNVTSGGEGVAGLRHSTESRLKMAQSASVRFSSPEARESLALRRKGRRDSQETRARKSAARRGEKHPQSKLTAESVVTIRSRLAAGEVARVVAADFGVSRETVSAIKNRRLWSHV